MNSHFVYCVLSFDYLVMPVVQAKKVKGVGLGNIFAKEPLTLRSQGIQPVRRQDVASSEKKDGPELKVCLMQTIFYFSSYFSCVFLIQE